MGVVVIGVVGEGNEKGSEADSVGVGVNGRGTVVRDTRGPTPPPAPPTTTGPLPFSSSPTRRRGVVVEEDGGGGGWRGGGSGGADPQPPISMPGGEEGGTIPSKVLSPSRSPPAHLVYGVGATKVEEEEEAMGMPVVFWAQTEDPTSRVFSTCFSGMVVPSSGSADAGNPAVVVEEVEEEDVSVATRSSTAVSMDAGSGAMGWPETGSSRGSGEGGASPLLLLVVVVVDSTVTSLRDATIAITGEAEEDDVASPYDAEDTTGEPRLPEASVDGVCLPALFLRMDTSDTPEVGGCK